MLPLAARSDGAQCSDPLWSHLWTAQRKIMLLHGNCEPAHLSPYISDTSWRAEHILQPDPFDTGAAGATSTPVQCVRRPVFKAWIVYWNPVVTAVQAHRKKSPETFPWVCRLDNLLSRVYIWVSLSCLHPSMNMSVWTVPKSKSVLLYSLICTVSLAPLTSCLAVHFSCFIILLPCL